MEEALCLFRDLYEQHHNVDVCIVELKRKGFNQMETIKVLMEALTINVVRADELVHDSLAWSD